MGVYQCQTSDLHAAIDEYSGGFVTSFENQQLKVRLCCFLVVLSRLNPYFFIVDISPVLNWVAEAVQYPNQAEAWELSHWSTMDTGPIPHNLANTCCWSLFCDLGKNGPIII